MKKNLLIFLFLITALFSFSSCSNSSNKDEIINTFKEAHFAPNMDKLLPKSLTTNEQKLNMSGHIVEKKLATIGTEIASGDLIYPKPNPKESDTYRQIKALENDADARKRDAIQLISTIELDGEWHEVETTLTKTKACYIEEDTVKILKSETKRNELNVITKNIIKIYEDGAVEIFSDGNFDCIKYMKNQDGKEFEVVFSLPTSALRYDKYYKNENGEYIGLRVEKDAIDTLRKPLNVEYSYGNDTEYYKYTNTHAYAYTQDDDGSEIPDQDIYYVQTMKDNMTLQFVRQQEGDNFMNGFWINLSEVDGIKSIDYSKSSTPTPEVNKIILDDDREIMTNLFMLNNNLSIHMNSIYGEGTEKNEPTIVGVTAFLSARFHEASEVGLSDKMTNFIDSILDANGLSLNKTIDCTTIVGIGSIFENLEILGIKNLNQNYSQFEIEVKKYIIEFDF